MIYYIILFLILSLFALSFFIVDKVDRFLIYISLIVFLVLFAGLRYQTGFDYDNYLRIYEDVGANGYSFEVEPSMSVIMGFLNKINISYAGFLFLFAFISIELKGHFLWRYSLSPFLSIALYFSRVFITADFGQIRQGFAAALVLWSFVYIKEKKLKKYSFLFLAAVSIHISALLFYPIYFIARKQVKPWVLITVLIAALPIATLDLKNIVVNYLTNFMPEYVAQKLLYYGENEAEEVIGLTYSVFLRISLIGILLAFYKQRVYENKDSLVVFNIYYWGVIFYLVFNSLPQLGGRGSLYFQQFELLLFPYLFSYLKHYLYKIAIFVFVTFYCYWGIISAIRSQEDAFVPYKSVIGK